MYLRPKTKRRLLILGSAFSLIVGVLLIGYVVRARRLSTQIGHAREQAMAAYAAGDHVAALEAFRFYLDESKTADKGQEADAEAILAYAKSRAAVEMDKGRHLYEAVKILEVYLRLRPGDAEARRMLFELQPRIGYNDESLTLADAALAANPADLDALWVRVRALRNKGAQDRQFYGQAFEAAEKLTQVAPLDLKAQVETLRLMLVVRKPDAEVVARAESLRSKYPNDPRFDLLLATSYLLTRQSEPAALWLKTAAAAKEAPDAAFSLELSRQLEAFGMFPLAQDVIERGAGQFPADADLARALAWRLWEHGRHEDVVKRFAPSTAGPKGDATLVALRALSLIALDRRGEAKTAADALSARKGDSAAAGWATVLQGRLSDAERSGDLRNMVAQYRAAIDRDPQNPVAHFLLGESYARMGETELAIDSWEAASRLAPSWAAPAAMVARASIDSGRYAEAVRAAEAAYRRAPRDIAVAGDWVIASYGLLQSERNGGDATSKADLLKNVEAVQKDAPGEPRTLPIYAALLADVGRRDEAVACVRAALKSNTRPSAHLVSRLTVVSRQYQLGLEPELVDRLGGAGDFSPRAVLRTAALLRDAGQPELGLQELQRAKQKSVAAGATVLPWDVATLQFRDLTGDETTLAEWVALADGNAKDLSVQTAALRSPSRAKDRVFWQRTISRIKDLTGQEGQLWQIEQARLTLAGDARGDELSAAIAQLEGVAKTTPESAEPRRLLALAYERRSRGKVADERRAAVARAAEEVQRAADLKPEDALVARDLVRILRLAGQSDQAVRHLDQLTSKPAALDGATRLWVAEAYADLGELDKAAALLANVKPAETDAATLGRLASIRRRQGRAEDAAALYDALLKSNVTDPALLMEGADFFADQGKPQVAQQFISKLAALPLRPGALELIRARFSDQRGDGEAALAQYRESTSVAKAGAQPWRELAGFLLRSRKFADAAAAAREGAKAAGPDADLEALDARASELASSHATANVPQSLLNALAVDPRSDAAAEMLRLLDSATDATGPAADAIRQAADRYPDFMPLQSAAVRALLAARQADRAEQVARRTATAFPAEPEAVRMLAEVYAARGDWAKSQDAAVAWRRLSGANPLPADLLLARASIETGDAAGAVDRLKPHVDAAPPDAPNARLIDLYARALVAGGRSEEAAALLFPLAQQAPTWRAAWLRLATSQRDADAAAKWIDRAAPLVPEDSAADRLALASAWYEVGQKFSAAPAYQNAMAVLTSGPDLGIDGQLLLAVCAQSVGDYDRAESAHRKVLEANPTLPDAKNNLAYALTLRGREADLAEARRLAAEAVAARADSATFRDTLARVDARGGHLDAAADGFRQALQADPYSVEARIGLADVLIQTGQPDEAKGLLSGIEKDLRLVPALPPNLVRQLDRVRLALRAAVPVGAPKR